MRKALLLPAVVGLVGTLWAADAFVGTWKMNPAKSRFSYPPPKSFISIIQAQDNGIKAVVDVIDADGNTIHRSLTAQYDGTDYPATATDIDTISFKKLDANTIDYVGKKNGKVLWTGRIVISKNGKTLIDAGGGKTADGEDFTYSIFAEKH